MVNDWYFVTSLLASEDIFDRQHAVNIKGTFFYYKYAGKQMIEQGRGGGSSLLRRLLRRKVKQRPLLFDFCFALLCTPPSQIGWKPERFLTGASATLCLCFRHTRRGWLWIHTCFLSAV